MRGWSDLLFALTLAGPDKQTLPAGLTQAFIREGTADGRRSWRRPSSRRSRSSSSSSSCSATSSPASPPEPSRGSHASPEQLYPHHLEGAVSMTISNSQLSRRAFLGGGHRARRIRCPRARRVCNARRPRRRCRRGLGRAATAAKTINFYGNSLGEEALKSAWQGILDGFSQEGGLQGRPGHLPVRPGGHAARSDRALRQPHGRRPVGRMAGPHADERARRPHRPREGARHPAGRARLLHDGRQSCSLLPLTAAASASSPTARSRRASASSRA